MTTISADKISTTTKRRLAAAGWVPSDEASCLSWNPVYELTGLNDNDLVTTLTDQSGNISDFQEALTRRPTYKTGGLNSQPYLLFNGTSNYMDNTLAPATWNCLSDGSGATVVLVVNSNDETAGEVFGNYFDNTQCLRYGFNESAPNERALVFSGGVNRGFTDGNSMTQTPAFITITYEYGLTGDDLVVKRNGVLSHSVNSASQPTTGDAGNNLRIGAIASASSSFTNMDLYDVMIFNTVNSELDANIADYMSRIYGL